MTEPGPEVPGPPQPEDDARARWLRRAWIAVGVGWVTVIFVGALLFFHIRDLEQAARESATTAERPRVKQATRPEPLDEAPEEAYGEPVAETEPSPEQGTSPGEGPPPEEAASPEQAPPSEGPEILDDDDIRQHISLTMNRNVRELQACYAVKLQEDPEFGGTYTLEFAIQRDGTPHEVNITGDKLPESLERCMVDTVMGFRFSRIAKEAPVRYPLVFRPGT